MFDSRFLKAKFDEWSKEGSMYMETKKGLLLAVILGFGDLKIESSLIRIHLSIYH